MCWGRRVSWSGCLYWARPSSWIAICCGRGWSPAFGPILASWTISPSRRSSMRAGRASPCPYWSSGIWDRRALWLSAQFWDEFCPKFLICWDRRWAALRGFESNIYSKWAKYPAIVLNNPTLFIIVVLIYQTVSRELWGWRVYKAAQWVSWMLFGDSLEINERMVAMVVILDDKYCMLLIRWVVVWRLLYFAIFNICWQWEAGALVNSRRGRSSPFQRSQKYRR